MLVGNLRIEEKVKELTLLSHIMGVGCLLLGVWVIAARSLPFIHNYQKPSEMEA